MSLIYILYSKLNTLITVSKDDVLDKLYFLEARIPTVNEVEKYLKNNPKPEIKVFFEKKNIEERIFDIKKSISKISNKIPLYDIYTKNLYLINKENVYDRVIYSHYRFPDKDVLNELKKEKIHMMPKIKELNKKKIKEENKNLGEFEKTDEIHYQKITNIIFMLRNYNKLKLMINFLESFDLEIMYTTYIKVFYFYASEGGKLITFCKRPSFLPHFEHIKPYYSRSEIKNMSLNMQLVKLEDLDESINDPNKIEQLCTKIIDNDINAETLLNHQLYILKENKVGLIQYYTLHGSYFMNQYLRNLTNYEYQNLYMEKLIHSMWELVNGAPAFDKSYILYRFINNDSHLCNLNVGDIYTESGFTSSTRDPFYKSASYKFGVILMRIKIPANRKGVALCIETMSGFPLEEEVILAPKSQFRLINKNENVTYYHTDQKFASEITTKYELEYIGGGEIKFRERPIYPLKNTVDFLKIDRITTFSVGEQINYFISKYVNPMFQFDAIIGNNNITIVCEWYNSVGAYEPYYVVKTNHGFSFYSFYKNHMLFIIEITEIDTQKIMFVNYYFKYSSSFRSSIITDEEFILFLSSIAYYFDIHSVIVYVDYKTCDRLKYENGKTKNDKTKNDKTKNDKTKNDKVHNGKTYSGGNYCVDFYKYLKNGEKKFSNERILNSDIFPKFSYAQLDKLKVESPMIILEKQDKDELYQIYTKAYKDIKPIEKDTIADYYIWIVENYCNLVSKLVNKMYRLYKDETLNPFLNDYYVLYPIKYLYNKKYINYIPESMYQTYQKYQNIDTLTPTSFNFNKTQILPKNIYRNNDENKDIRNILS